MTIRAVPGSHDWEVRGYWNGEVRRVFFGTIFGCLAFVANHS